LNLIFIETDVGWPLPDNLDKNASHAAYDISRLLSTNISIVVIYLLRLRFVTYRIL